MRLRRGSAQGALDRSGQLLDALALAAGAGHGRQLLGALNVRLGGLGLSSGQQGVAQVAAECGLGAVVGAVHPGQRGAQVLDGAGVTEAHQAVAAPAGQVVAVERQVRHVLVGGPVRQQDGGLLQRGAAGGLIPEDGGGLGFVGGKPGPQARGGCGRGGWRAGIGGVRWLRPAVPGP